MKRIHSLIRVTGLLPLAAAVLSAQWLHQPTVGIARTPDGRPDLTAAAPRAADGRPDLSGLWRIAPVPTSANIAEQLKPDEIQPWAAALYRRRTENLRRESLYVACLPTGPLNTHFSTPDGLKIVQTPNLIVILYADFTFRQVFLDGRSLPEDPNPVWMGYSIGHWEGDTLVVESAGYNDRTWLDGGGHPHSEGLRIIERFHRTALGHIDLKVTLNDPTLYARPIEIDTRMQAIFDTQMLEYVCAENEKDRVHLVGTTADDPVVHLSPEILSRYAGTYTMQGPAGPVPVGIVLTGGELSMDHPIFGRMAMRAISESTFSAGGTSVRFAEEDGAMTLTVNAAEGQFKGVRQR